MTTRSGSAILLILFSNNLHFATSFCTHDSCKNLSFQIHSNPRPRQTFPSLKVYQSSNKENEEEEWINPFEQASSLGKTRRSVPDVTNISVRQMRMNDLVSSLLQCVNDNIAMTEVLSENEALLMEPFSENYDPKLDRDSIYSEGMNRDERMDKYATVMDERIQQAKSENARIILSVMRTFVLARRSSE